MWLGAKQHDYAVGLASHLPQLAAVAMASFLYNHLDENGLPITLGEPDCAIRCGLRAARMPRQASKNPDEQCVWCRQYYKVTTYLLRPEK